MQFYVRSFNNPRGYDIRQGKLPRSRQESYVPWAIAQDGNVVYAMHRAHRERPRGALQPYNAMISKRRRQECETALGMFALRNHQVARPAVKTVSTALISYLNRCSNADTDKTLDVVHGLSRYFFSDTSFARLGTRSDAPGDTRIAKIRFFQTLKATMETGPVPEVLNIQDQVGRVGSRELGGPEKARWVEVNKILRPAYLFDSANRGRRDRADRRNPDPTYNRTLTTTPGILPTGTGGDLGQTHQARERGADRFRRTADSELNAYYYDLDDRNLTFGAGPSGTTGTLLTTAIAFGALSGEALKQYLFGIIGYLVGGGMHSIHESFTVAALCPGINYSQGSFTDMLPQNFTMTQIYQDWWAKYYDIAELGGTHWVHGSASPSKWMRVPQQAI